MSEPITHIELEKELPCRDCDGTGLFYQIEDCPCHCVTSGDEKLVLVQ